MAACCWRLRKDITGTRITYQLTTSLYWSAPRSDNLQTVFHGSYYIPLATIYRYNRHLRSDHRERGIFQNLICEVLTGIMKIWWMQKWRLLREGRKSYASQCRNLAVSSTGVNRTRTIQRYDLASHPTDYTHTKSNTSAVQHRSVLISREWHWWTAMRHQYRCAARM